MKIIHSFWSKPAVENRWGVKGQIQKNIWLNALSLIYAKQVAPMVALHTDKMGAELLKDLPYDKVHNTLDDLDTVPAKFWAYGKIVSLDREPVNTIHIDADVFLKKPALKADLFNPQSDLVVQMIEGGGIYKDVYLPQLPFAQKALQNEKIDGLSYNYKHAYNCGVVGFHNKALKDKYCKNAGHIVEAFSKDKTIMKEMDGKLEINCWLEQYYLYSLVQERKEKPNWRSAVPSV